jgi:hypothetical protein
MPIRVVFGPPLDFSDLSGKRGAVEAATHRLTETLATMLGQPVPEGRPRNRADEPPPLPRTVERSQTEAATASSSTP